MRLSHIEARIEQQIELTKLISDIYDDLIEHDITHTSYHEILLRLNVLREDWQKFATIHDAINIAITKLKLEEENQIREHIYFSDNLFTTTRKNYITNCGRLQSLLESDQIIGKESTPSQSSCTTSSNPIVVSYQARLPRIDIPKFNGTPSDWLSFKDLFQSLVLNHPTLTAVEKLQYLKTSLVGSAARHLKNVSISGDNFEKAWQNLTSFYENKRLLVNAALHAFLNLKKIIKESASELEQLYTNILQVYSSLELLGRPVSACDDFLVFIATQKLDNESIKAWEQYLGNTTDPPTWTQFMGFLITRLRTLQAFEKSKIGKSDSHSQGLKTHFQGKQKENKSDNTLGCNICTGKHQTAMCNEFTSKSRTQKLSLIARYRLCYNCLGSHRIANCPSTRRCRKCGKKHHTSIHNDPSQATVSGDKDEKPTKSSDSTERTTEARVLHSNICHGSLQAQTLLATAQIRIISLDGHTTKARVLLDQGSEVSLVTERLVQRLKISRQRSSVPLVGIGAQSSNKTKGLVHFRIKPHFDSNFETTISAHILPSLTSSIPTMESHQDSWTHLKGLQLADPHFSSPGPIDLLLGAEVYAQILNKGIIRGQANTPIAQSTTLGWIVSGPTGTGLSQSSFSSYHVSPDKNLCIILQRFWELESVPAIHRSSLTPEEQECETHFKTTHSRNSTGRYIVRLPFKNSVEKLGDSRQRANLLCNRLLRRCATDLKYAQAYVEFLTEYQKLGHMRQVSDSTYVPPHAYYLPHHGVWKETSNTTKLRVVFNGSKSTTSGYSLNDILHSGAKLQVDIFDVLLWFRQFRYVFSADIEKMFRQINVHPDDWKYQRIIWEDQNHQLVPFELTTVTYGLVCAPFQALRAIQQLTEDEGTRFPQAISTMTKGRYVDDLFGGADSITEAKECVKQVNQLCMAGGFPLRKWISNNPNILEEISPENHLDSHKIKTDDNLMIYSLGSMWDPSKDIFYFHLDLVPTDTITKRIMLSTTARIFDPLGFLSPVIITAKILIQETWSMKIDWDDPLPPIANSKWTKFITSCQDINKLRFPRWIGTDASSLLEIHGFCDASSDAMAAVVYSRSTSSEGQVAIQFVCSKTKVAPLKKLTIPRLELSGAVLLVKLVSQVLRVLNRKEIKVYLWTDSSITLTWIKGCPSRWKEFIQNRTYFIQDTLPQAKWSFVPGNENPADLATRGMTPIQLAHMTMWWHGPTWLSQSSTFWPSAPERNFTGEQLEERPIRVNNAHVASPQPWDLLDRYSDLSRLLRITVICQRAVARFKLLPNKPTHTPISPTELHLAKQFWIKEVQRATFQRELKLLSEGKVLPKSNSLIRLTPYIDAVGILRVGGRLRSSNLSDNAKHPAILPRNSRLSSLVIAESHLRSFHGGTQLTTSFIREEFWIIGGRASVRRHIIKCVICARFRQKRAQQLMGQLPPERVTPSRPFLHSGVDYAGPVIIKTWRAKNARTYKAYVALFVCFSTSAVHLELVTDYTADAFIAAYKRFTSRRGVCATLTSDCGTNLKGANAELQRLFSSASKEAQNLATLLSKDGTLWKFNPPSAPHFGGKWEAGVKSMKYHLKRVVGNTLLTYEEMNTLLIQVEAILNSRPLSALTDDPDDLTVLTPGHFLMGCAPTVIPEPSLDNEKTSRLSRWQLLRKMLDSLWTRWSTEYLQRYHSIYKWNQATRSITEGSMVLVVDERYPPAKWPMGRVVKIHPGSDGLVRVVTVKTQTSEMKRPITKLCLLPTDKD
ncbi:uncharacterized protein [Linepithema humile]|uniref:uncharacterized protein n=1 Tax=Linepithema humile TaxID=83485 RepID=UPI00351F43DC